MCVGLTHNPKRGIQSVSLKQSIVIRNEYTNNVRSDTNKGSRGGSPGQYVTRYMAREDATEVLTPVKPSLESLDAVDSYDSKAFTRYMVRSSATERLKSRDDELAQDADAYGSPLVLKHRFRQIDKKSGRAFGSRGISLSHEDLRDSSQAIQEAFDDGHSVQKVILSFTEDYLREQNVLSPDFKHKGRGSYMGQVDQLKLRGAITKGVKDLTKAGKYIDPEWVGTLQFDTSYVHAHIALVDKEFSDFRMKDDGADRGKINEREKYMFRKGMHFELEDMKQLKSFHRQTSLERQNVVAFVKDYAYTTLHENTSVQLLVASLPKDRTQWRYGTNRESMTYANEMATDIVERVFENEPDRSGFRQAMVAVNDYADESKVKNKLSDDERSDLVTTGREHIVERSVNGLYSTIRGLDPNLLRTRTPMTDIQSSSDEELAKALRDSDDGNEFDPAAFTLRVRGYNTRQETHRDSARDYYDLSDEYEDALDKGYVDDTAHVMRLFYEEEQRYHMGLTDKYRTFLSFHHPKDRTDVIKEQPKYEALKSRFEHISSQEEISGVTHTDQRNDYKNDLRAYTFNCFEKGVASLQDWDAIIDYDSSDGRVETRFVLPVRPKTRLENLNDVHFNSVKALDVHHLGLDYYNTPDARIDTTNATLFAEAWASRKSRADIARGYVDSTAQQLPVLDRAEKDIGEMEVAVDKAVDEGLIQRVSLDDVISTEKRQLYTISVDHTVDITNQVRQTLEHLDYSGIEPETEELE